MTRQEQKVLLFISLLFALGAALSVFRKTSGCGLCLLSPPTSGPATRPIDLNLAMREDLIAVPGIGPSTADAIIAFRTEAGKVDRLEDLVKIKGISSAKLDRWRKYLYVNETEVDTQVESH